MQLAKCCKHFNCFWKFLVFLAVFLYGCDYDIFKTYIFKTLHANCNLLLSLMCMRMIQILFWKFLFRNLKKYQKVVTEIPQRFSKMKHLEKC